MEKAEETLKKLAKNISNTSTTESDTSQKDGLGDPNCPNCLGVGFVSSNANIEDPDFGKLHTCTCRLENLQEAITIQKQNSSSLGRLSEKTFDNFIPSGNTTDPMKKDSLERAYQQSLRFAKKPEGWILLHGGYGCGKTHLAAAIGNYSITIGHDVLFVNIPDLLDHLRSTFAPGSTIDYDTLFDKTRNIFLLILDDLGSENPTQWAQEKLYQIINHRYTTKLPTVVTSNVNLESIEPRIRSRLVDIDLVRKLMIQAPDFRRADSDQTDLSSLPIHKEQTFENFYSRKKEIPNEHYERLLTATNAAKTFATNPEGWLLLIGGHGCGKTHLAAAISNQRIQNGHSALFITTADLLDHLRATFSPNSPIRFDKQFSTLRNAPLLVLDDLTIESATPWAKEKLMQLIDHRYVTKLPTIITTAADKSDLGTRLESRLLNPDISIICPITAPMYKGKKTSNK
tara:strand:- start:60 stop:1430 length:1371 start_codon:yes stop_codon:yes gene_type:complete